MNEKDVRKALLEHGKKKGVVTFEELNIAFPAEYLPLDEMEKFLRRLEHLGIRVVESREKGRTGDRHRRAA